MFSKKIGRPFFVALLLSFNNSTVEAACQCLTGCNHPGCNGVFYSGQPTSPDGGCVFTNFLGLPTCSPGKCIVIFSPTSSGVSVTCDKTYSPGCCPGKACVNDQCITITSPPTDSCNPPCSEGEECIGGSCVLVPVPTLPPNQALCRRRKLTEDGETCYADDACCAPTPPPEPEPTPPEPTPTTPTAPTSNEDDPIINGFGGQVFKFYGRSDAWYSMLSTNSLQWNQHFYEYDQCARNIEDKMFITKTSLYLPKIDQKISIEITDYGDKSPGCPQDMPNCLGDGTLSVFIDGNEIIKPGLYPLKEGSRIIAHNFDWICAQKPMDHFTEVNNEDAVGKLKGHTASKNLDARSGRRNSRRRRRRLSEEPSHDKDHNIAIGMLIDKTKSNKRGVNELERCEEWIQKHSNEKSLFDEPGYWSIIHVETQYLHLRIEYLFVEEDHCYRRHLNTYVEKISPELFDDGQWKGIAGETRYIKYNEDGSPIKTNRYDVLASDNDEDYEVDGPFGTTFVARNTKESPSFSKDSVETVNSYDDDVFVI